MENKIIRYIKNNNHKGLDLLVENYSKNVYLLVKSILRDYINEEEIENCVSDIFIDVYKDIDSYNKEKLSFNKFILLKAKNRALNYRVELSGNEKKEEKINNKIITMEDIISDEVLEEYDSKEVINIIKSFQQPDKTYFYLAYFRGYDIDTLAYKFNDSSNGVLNRILKCKFKLKTILKKEANLIGR
ncbi:MAG: sigma-70 family RNA polymerase sigma factor [Peptostreptococcaceae bacterium]